jgi:preprotein translocase subunit SecB
MTNKKKTAKTGRRKVASNVRADNVFEYLKLTNVRLVSLSTELVLHAGKLPVHAKIRAKPNAGISSDGTHLNGNVELEVISKPDGEEDVEDTSTATIKAHYQCVYEIHGATSGEIAPHGEIIANTVMYVAWPYLRELCNSLTNKMGLPPVTLPMLAPPQTSSEGLKLLASVTAPKATKKLKKPPR